jgi:hypothetical protein
VVERCGCLTELRCSLPWVVLNESDWRCSLIQNAGVVDVLAAVAKDVREVLSAK